MAPADAPGGAEGAEPDGSVSGADRSASAVVPGAPRVLAWLRRRRLAASLLAHLALSAGALALAFVVRFDIAWPDDYTRTFLAALVPLLVLRGAATLLGRLHTHRWRFTNVGDLVDLLVATAGSSVVFFWAGHHWLPVTPTVPRSVVLLEFVFAANLIGGARLGYRMVYEWLRRDRRPAEDQRDVLVVGAGEAGNRLVREIRRYPEHGFRPVGFVDDDPSKRGTRVQGLPVVGSVEEVSDLVEGLGIEVVVIAIPSATPARLRAIVERCEACDAEVVLLPPVRDVLEGQVRLGQLREVRLEDLLAREPVSLEVPALREHLEGRVVLVTGAAGSIGSELARQVADYGPERLVLVDQAESDLYMLARELERSLGGDRLVPAVADILDGAATERLFREHRPDRVYHAAAYKHVPLMEANPRAAVRNNVLGTREVADLAGRSGAEHFVLVSTDKAVAPRSLMGATKRVAERLVLAMAGRHAATSFTAVRFGNVLGSQGSVVPLFERQLAEGGPLTVTHPEATRFFMTISEAAQLVLQASMLAEARNRITMLEMGEPVRIDDVARTLLRLAGVGKERMDEMIEYIGLRPGEKLHEELTGEGEETVSTEVEKVRVVRDDAREAGGDLLERADRWASLVAERREEDVVEEIWAMCGRSDGPDRSGSGAAAGGARREAAGGGDA